jgi:hypothetical protein
VSAQRVTYESARAGLTAALRAEPALAQYIGDNDSDWIFALCDVWGALAEVIGFYQCRILDEAFLSTATQDSSEELIYHSLGHAFPPNATATTTLAYHLQSSVAGVEAVSRLGSAGGTGMSPQTIAQLSTPTASGNGATASGSSASTPASAAGNGQSGGTVGSVLGLPSVGTPAGITAGTPSQVTQPLSLGVSSAIPGAAQVRAIPTGNQPSPVFVTLAPIAAYVGATRLTAYLPPTMPPALTSGATMLELAGTQTGLAVGQPVLLSAAPQSGGGAVRWIRLLTDVHPDPKRGSTRISWNTPLGTLAGEPALAGVGNLLVYGFARSSALTAANAPEWSSQTTARQLQTTTLAGGAIPIRGGFASSADAGSTWTLNPAGLPVGVDLAAVGAYNDLAIVSAGASGLLRSVAGMPFTATTLGGGSRRPVGFLGGTSARMLAGASAGVVYESLDQGQTWSPVTGGPPQLVSAPSTAPTAPTVPTTPTTPATPLTPVTPTATTTTTPTTATTTATPSPPPPPPSTPSTQTVVTHQLPSATVRCVMQDPAAPADDPGMLLAGTDAGLYAYTAGNWQAVTDIPGQPAVFALVARADGTLAAATAAGVFIRTAGTWATSAYGGLSTAVYQLTEAAGDLYAAVSGGISAYVGNAWQSAGEGLPSGIPINALLGDSGKLLAATPQGIYAATGESPALTWSRCDHAAAFTFADADLVAPPATAATSPTPTDTSPGAGVLAAFADYGIELSSAAQLTSSDGGYLLVDGAHSYQLSQTAGTGTDGGAWQVTLLDAMPGASGLAQSGDGPVLAVGAAAASAANEWPGFEVAGTSVEITPVRGVAPGMPAIIEQGTPAPSNVVLDVTAVDQDAGVRAGRNTQLTRLHFSESLPAGQFPRRASTVWTGAGVLPVFDPPSALVAQVSGSTISLSAPLSAPVQAGQLVAVTGSPPGLAIAPLGGAMWLGASSTTPMIVGPPEADLYGVAIGSDGSVYLAGAEGVFTVPAAAAATGSGVPQPVTTGWPGGSSAGVTVAGANVLAASASGVQLLELATGGAPGGWSTASANATQEVVALAGDGKGAVASLSGGGMIFAAAAAQTPTSWTNLTSLTPAPDTLAISGSTIYAANTAGVFEYSSGAWTALPAGAITGAIAVMQIDASGTLWAGGAGGLESYEATTKEWRREPQVIGKVEALCLRPSGSMAVTAKLAVAGVHAVGEQQGTDWNQISSAPAATLSGMAGAPDGSLWLATRTSASLVPSSGTQEIDIAHAQVLTGADVTDADILMLSQGGVPDTLVGALADAGVQLDPGYVVGSATETDCWLIHSGGELYIVVHRSASGSTLDVYRNQTTVYPTAPAGLVGNAQTWSVLAGGIPATVTVQQARVQVLPADADSPSFAETAAVAATTADAQAAVALAPTGTISLQDPLAHIYDAATVQVNLNAVSAAAGQPVSAPIGSGDPQQANQAFPVSLPIAAIGATAADPTASPTSSLSVYVNGQPWTAVPSLLQSGPDATVYVERANKDGSATVTFGDGVHGARLPAGQDNVVATYLQGGGAATAVASGALIQALDRPQLVTAVHNPAPALVPPTPPPAQARNAAVRSLDRTVTVEDYQDLVLAQVGVTSTRVDVLAGPPGRVIVITVALATDAPVRTLDNVATTVGTLSSSGLPVRVVAATAVPVLATVQVISAQPADAIEPLVRTALSGFAAQAPGDPMYAAQVLSALTAVTGVVAAEIVGWERHGNATTTATSLSASRATWPAQTSAPTGAELLSIDGSAQRLTIEVVAPNS